MKNMAFCDAMVLAVQNVKPDVWPAEAIDPGKCSKSQTRRLIKPQPPDSYCYKGVSRNRFLPGESEHLWMNGYACWRPKLRFQVGDVFYVKEGLFRGSPLDSAASRFATCYRGDFAIATVGNEPCGRCFTWRWKRNFLPSIFMPREAARTWGVVKAVRAERVQHIRPGDVKAEGFQVRYTMPQTHSLNDRFVPATVDCKYLDKVDQTFYEGFAGIWNHLHGPDAWERNDWVWVYEFARISNPQRTQKSEPIGALQPAEPR